DTTAYGRRGFTVTGVPVAGNWLQVTVTKTNGSAISLGATNNSGWTLTQLAQALLDKINTNTSPSLQGLDGLTGEDLVLTGVDGLGNPARVEFNLRARGAGWDAAQIQADLNASI